MAVNSNFRVTAYGEKNPSQFLAKPPIIARRAPTSQDKAVLGQMWIDTSTNAYYVVTSIGNSGSNWVPQSTGSATQSSLDITGGAGTVLTVQPNGGTDLGGILDVAGVATFSDDVIINGDLQANGDVDISSASAISFTSTANVAPSILFETNGGTTETIKMFSNQGTALNSIDILSDDGGIKLTSTTKASTQAINLVAAAGGVQLDAALTSTVNVTGAGQDFVVNATGGSIALNSTESTAGAISLIASGAVGTVSLAGTGGLSLTSTNAPISIQSGTGAVNIATAPAQTNVTIGSTTGTSSTDIRSGSGGLRLFGVDGVSVGNTSKVLTMGTLGSADKIGTAIISAGTGIGIVNTANTITVSASPGFTITSISQANSPYDTLFEDQLVSVDCSGGAVTVRLPNAISTGKVIIIKDSAGFAATNNITVTTSGGSVTIDGATSYAINSNYQSVEIIFDGTKYLIL